MSHVDETPVWRVEAATFTGVLSHYFTANVKRVSVSIALHYTCSNQIASFFPKTCWHKALAVPLDSAVWLWLIAPCPGNATNSRCLSTMRL